jgi:hypothetical protein
MVCDGVCVCVMVCVMVCVRTVCHWLSRAHVDSACRVVSGFHETRLYSLSTLSALTVSSADFVVQVTLPLTDGTPPPNGETGAFCLCEGESRRR